MQCSGTFNRKKLRRAIFFFSNEFRKEQNEVRHIFFRTGLYERNESWLQKHRRMTPFHYFDIPYETRKRISGQQLSSLEIGLGSHRIQVWDHLPFSQTYSLFHYRMFFFSVRLERKGSILWGQICNEVQARDTYTIWRNYQDKDIEIEEVRIARKGKAKGPTREGDVRAMEISFLFCRVSGTSLI